MRICLDTVAGCERQFNKCIRMFHVFCWPLNHTEANAAAICHRPLAARSCSSKAEQKNQTGPRWVLTKRTGSLPRTRRQAPHQRLREQAAATLLAAAADGTLEAVLSKKQQAGVTCMSKPRLSRAACCCGCVVATCLA